MSAIISPVPYMEFHDAAGLPLAGGLLYTYQAGTTTPQASYTDATGSVANTNPIVLDLFGGASVWLAPGTAYKFVLASSIGTQLWSVDNVAPNGTLAAQNASGVNITGGTITGVTISGAIINNDVNGGANSVAGVVGITHGGTGAITSAAARAALGGAGAGANSDITSLTGLTTPLSVAQGGTGITTLAALIASIGITGVSNIVAANPGGIKLGTLELRFGTVNSSPAAGQAGVTATFSTPFPTGFLACVGSPIGSGGFGSKNTSFTRSAGSVSSVTYQWSAGFDAITGFDYIAIGH